MREEAFPLELLEKAYEIRVEQGEASMEEDRQRILNSIAGKPLESEPDLQHPAYDAVNRVKFEYVLVNPCEKSQKSRKIAEKTRKKSTIFAKCSIGEARFLSGPHLYKKSRKNRAKNAKITKNRAKKT